MSRYTRRCAQPPRNRRLSLRPKSPTNSKWRARSDGPTRRRSHQADQSGEALPVENAESEPALRVWAREHHEPEYDEKPFADQPESSIFEPVQPAVQEFAERIPTMPPPNREALSQIPFLMPNPEREPVISDGTHAANSAAVDEVVRRVV